MRIRTHCYRLPRYDHPSWMIAASRGLADLLPTGTYPLRFSIVGVGPDTFDVETTMVEFDPGDPNADRFAGIEMLEPRRKPRQADPFVAVQIVPTGVRCAFGGYAGDAGPVTNLLASAVDHLVTHPNAVNASDLNEMADNVLYVEGKSLDDFLLGHLGLAEVRANRIGTFVDPTGLALIDHVTNALDAARAVKGIDCSDYTILDAEAGVEIDWTPSGCAVGTIARPEAILDAVGLLIEQGVDAVGGVSVIHGVTENAFASHLRGQTPNPSGGVEAIITHLISKAFRVPTAHAPLPYYRDVKKGLGHDPRASAEFISTPHYFSVLKGLARAPKLVALPDLLQVPPAVLSLNNVGAIVLPASCLGGIPALAAEYNAIPLIAVRENSTVLDVTNAKMRMANVIEVETYLEAAGVLLALGQGISMESLRRPLAKARQVISEKANSAIRPAAE